MSRYELLRGLGMSRLCRISIWNVSFLFSFCKTHYLMVSLQRSKTKPTHMCVSLWGRQEWLHQVLQCFLFSSRRSLWWPSTLVSKLLKNCLNCLKHLPCHRLVLSHVASQNSLFIIISVSLIKTTGHHLYIPIAAIPNVLGERKANLCPRSSLKLPIEKSSKVQDFSFKTIDDFPHVYRKFHSQLHFMIWFFFKVLEAHIFPCGSGLQQPLSQESVFDMNWHQLGIEHCLECMWKCSLNYPWTNILLDMQMPPYFLIILKGVS